MVIVCPSCATEYTLDPTAVGDAGRTVRCSQCGTSWFAKSDSLLADDAPALQRGSAVVIDGDLGPARARSRGRVSAKDNRGWTGATTINVSVVCIAVTVAAALAGIAFRVPIVRAAPVAGSLFAVVRMPVNLVGLTLEDVAAGIADDGGRRELVTEGRITNVTARDISVPDLSITVEGHAGETLYRWSAKSPVPEVPTGEARRFSIRLASPPPGAARVLVALRDEPRAAQVAPH